MFATIVLAFDGSREGRVALHQGAELARQCGAQAHLVAVLRPPSGFALAEGIYPVEAIEREEAEVKALVKEGVAMLREEGLQAEGHLAVGEPADQISQISRQVGADLVVVGHRHSGPLARWWIGSVGRSLLDALDCSLLVAMERVPAAERDQT